MAMYVRMEKHVAHQGIIYQAVTRGKLAGDIPGLYSSLQQLSPRRIFSNMSVIGILVGSRYLKAAYSNPGESGIHTRRTG